MSTHTIVEQEAINNGVTVEVTLNELKYKVMIPWGTIPGEKFQIICTKYYFFFFLLTHESFYFVLLLNYMYIVELFSFLQLFFFCRRSI